MEQYTVGRQASGHFISLYGKKTFTQIRRYDDLVRAFKKKHKARYCYLASSSGRVELIGNHTDHNGGMVVGCTVNLDIVAAFLPNNTNTVTVCGNGYRDISFNLDEVDTVDSGSLGMVKGVLSGLKRHGRKIGGFDAVCNTILPSGAGISSSAAFQLLIGTIQNALYNHGQIPPRELAEIGQYAENVYFQKPCGLLDQGVIAVGGVVQIDFSHGFEEHRLPGNLCGLNIVVVDTGKSHAGLTDHYAAIPKEMHDVAVHFGRDKLIDVDENLFFTNINRVSREVGQRAALRTKHFFEENARVKAVGDALSKNDKQKLLQLINQSGDSSITQLQNCNVGQDHTVADAVNFAREICPECASRVHGGGFQGTILALVDNTKLSHLVEEMGKHYGKEKVHVLKLRTVGATVL